MLVVLVAQAVGLGLALTAALILAAPLPGTESLAWAAAAAILGIAGLVAFYRALATGRMGIVAPVAGVLGAAIPVVVGAIDQGLPTAVQAVGVGLAVVSVALVSRPGDQPASAGDRAALALAILAGVGFGFFIVFMHRAGDASVAWLVTASRTVSVTVLLGTLGVLTIAGTRPRSVGTGWIRIAVLAGAFDVTGNALFVAAAQTGRLDVAAVTSSLYPITTVILARIVLGERFAHVHVVGIVAAVTAIVFIAAG